MEMDELTYEESQCGDDRDAVIGLGEPAVDHERTDGHADAHTRHDKESATRSES